MAENIINRNLSGFTKEMLDMTYPDEYYKNTIQPAKAGTGPVPSKMQMFSKFQPGKAMMIGMDPYLPGFMQQGYDKFRAAPTQAVKNIAGTLGKGITSLASLPAQAAMFTLGSTPANADEANMSPEDFAALAESEGMTYGSSPITSSPINLDERYADQLAPGAYGKMGENVYTKMDDGSTRMDPYASQKFYDDRMFNDYFATNRYEDFNPRVGNMSTSTPQIGDAISRTNVQGMDYEMDPGAFMNPNIQPSQNMFQRAGNFVKDLELEEYLPFIGERSLTGMLGRGIGNLFQNIAPARYGTSGRAFNALTPQGRSAVGRIYGQDGIMQGYNPVSAFGRGPIGAIDNRIANIYNRRAPQTVASQQKMKDLFADREKIMQTTLDSDSRYTGPKSSPRGQKAGVMDDDPFGGTSGTTGGSSKIVCTMMNESYGFGNFRNKIWLKHSRDLPKEYEIGYHTIFLPLVKFAKGEGKLNKVVKKTLEHIARHRTLDLKQEMKGKTHTLGRVYRKILEPICLMVGKIKKAVK